MRERNRLQTAIAGYETLVRDLDDNIERIELGESEGDPDIVSDA